MEAVHATTSFRNTMNTSCASVVVIRGAATNDNTSIRFEVFKAVTMKNDIFWNVTPCGSCKNRHFGRT
jgi:cytidine deaminase